MSSEAHEVGPSEAELESKHQDHVVEDAESDSDEEEAPDSVTMNESGVMAVQSLCMNCHGTAQTKIYPTKIPFFQEIIVMSSYCKACGFRSNEIRPAGEIKPMGSRLTLSVTTPEDLNRQVVRSDSASFSVPELGFEIPGNTQKGSMNTIEGILQRAVDGLRSDQEERRRVDPENAARIDQFLAMLGLFAAGLRLPFTVIVDDPSGNSHIENPNAPTPDPNLRREEYARTKEQNVMLGLYTAEDFEGEDRELRERRAGVLPADEEGKEVATAEEGKSATAGDGEAEGEEKKEGTAESAHRTVFFESSAVATEKEIMSFTVTCPSCGSHAHENMCVTDIPHFKEVIIMALTCDHCGYRNNTIKGGGSIPAKGKIIRLDVTPDTFPMDIRRDFLKSDTAEITIPEIELTVEQGSLGGMYTTLEGILQAIKDKLLEGHSFLLGDSADGDNKFRKFVEVLDKVLLGSIPFTFIVKDPLANSWVLNPYAPEADPRQSVEEYTRSEEEDESLGITDMRTEGYEAPTAGERGTITIRRGLDAVLEEEEEDEEEEDATGGAQQTSGAGGE